MVPPKIITNYKVERQNSIFNELPKEKKRQYSLQPTPKVQDLQFKKNRWGEGACAYLAMALQCSTRNTETKNEQDKKMGVFLAKFEFSANPPTNSENTMASLTHSRSTTTNHQHQHH
jgi:hypothetical protein